MIISGQVRTILANGSENWADIPSVGDSKWLSANLDEEGISHWYINEVSGNDKNIGTSDHPVKTYTEIQRRWGWYKAPVPQSVVIHQLSSLTTPGFLSIFLTTPGTTVTIIATPTNSIIDTVAEWQMLSHGAYGGTNPTPSMLTLTTNTTASMTGTRLRFPIPDGGTAYSQFGTSNPTWGGSLGATSCSCVVPRKTTTNLFTSNVPRYTPLVGQNVYIETLATIPSLSIDIESNENHSLDSSIPRTLILDGINVTDSVDNTT